LAWRRHASSNSREEQRHFVLRLVAVAARLRSLHAAEFQ
jgi:hypothetical protein